MKAVLELQPELQRGFAEESVLELWAACTAGPSFSKTQLSFYRTLVQSVSKGQADLANETAPELATALLSWCLQIGQLPLEAASWACEALGTLLLHRKKLTSLAWKVFMVTAQKTLPVLLKNLFEAEKQHVHSKRSLQFSPCLQSLSQMAVLLDLPCTYDESEFKQLFNMREAMHQARALHADSDWTLAEDEALLA